jgi:Ca2+/Na+ antiporter
VINNAKDNVVNLPKGAVIKELLFYALALTVIIGFGISKSAGWPFVIAYAICYSLYVGVTLFLESGKKDDDVNKQLDEFNDLVDEENAQGNVTDDEVNNADVGSGVNIDVDGEKKMEEDQADQKKEGKEEEKTDEAQLAKDNLETDDMEEEKEKGLIGRICAEMFPEGNSMIENMILGPLCLISMFCNSYLENPLMVFPFKFIVISNSLIFMLYFLELTDLEMVPLLIVGYVFGAICFVLELIKVSKFVLEIVYEIISVFAAIGWISIFAGMVIDCIGFLAFYFSINEVILATLLLSAGNTVGDYFGNGALAKSGEEVMAMMGVYSGQLFNNFVGFAATMAAASSLGITDFDLFAQDHIAFMPDGEPNPPPMGSYFLIVVMGFVFIDIFLSLGVHFSNRFVATKSFGAIMQPYYGIFFVTSLVFGFMSSGA